MVRAKAIVGGSSGRVHIVGGYSSSLLVYITVKMTVPKTSSYTCNL